MSALDSAANVTLTPASADPESFDRVISLHDASAVRSERPAGLVPSIALDDKESVARVRREVALWTGHRMKEVRDVVDQAAWVDVTALVTGETGTGKEIVARAIHYLGARRNGPFVKVNCAAVARELLESELFGHERGAFTGAHQLKVGKFEAANEGTIFLDEIGDLHPALQGKLLHVLEDGQFSRVGGRWNINVDVRVIAATNQNLEQAVAAGLFREDLFYRLNVVRIAVPPLRERAEEIPHLAHYFVDRYSKLFQRLGCTVPTETMQRLVRHSFPGNVRELENTIKRMIVLDDPDLTKGPLPDGAPHRAESQAVPAVKPTAVSLKEISRKAAHAAERSAILKALEETQWNRIRAARLLNISYRSLLYKIKDAALDRNRRATDRP
jgi:two-component system, NtrC family, response regulator AtoC